MRNSLVAFWVMVVCIQYVDVSNGDFECCNPVLKQPQCLILHLHHTRTYEHTHTLLHTVSAQVAVSAACTAYAVLLIGCDR